MSLVLLANTVADAAAQILQTDTSDAATTGGLIQCIEQGSRFTYWNSGVTAARRAAYVNKTNKLSADYLVLIDAINHLGKQIKVLEWSDYAATGTTLLTKTLGSSDLVGHGGRDYVYAFSSLQTDKEAFGIELSTTDYTKTLTALYFSEGLSFDYFLADRSVEYAPVSIHDAPVILGNDRYFLTARMQFTVGNVSQDTVNDYLALPDTEPVFFYDASGNTLEHKLLHCIILESEVQELFNDFYSIRFVVGIIRDDWII